MTKTPANILAKSLLGLSLLCAPALQSSFAQTAPQSSQPSATTAPSSTPQAAAQPNTPAASPASPSAPATSAPEATRPATAPQSAAPTKEATPAAPTPPPSAPAASAPAPMTPAAPSGGPVRSLQPSPTAPFAITPTPGNGPAPSPLIAAPPDLSDASSAQTIDVKSRPVLIIRGASNWDDGYKAIRDALTKLRAAAAKAGLKEAGRPLTSFIDTDDLGFKFEAMLPIDAAPEGKPELGSDVKAGLSPSGKALKFQHRGAYDDIDSTYEAITAYLDEKGLDAQNVFVEEYLNEPKGSDDTALALDIYVFIK